MPQSKRIYLVLSENDAELLKDILKDTVELWEGVDPRNSGLDKEEEIVEWENSLNNLKRVKSTLWIQINAQKERKKVQ